MEKGFEKADSGNLPLVSMEMVSEFLMSSENYYSAEIRNVKLKRSSKEQYGDNAVSYVQLKRENQHCTVQCRITPEHKVHKKAYAVIAVIDENTNSILSCECKDCAASLGGCKHAVAFVFWLHRRSEEPSTTSKECYWKGSALSRVGKQDAYMSLKDMTERPRISLEEKNENLVEAFLNTAGKQDGGIFELYFESPLNQFDLFHLILKYKTSVNTYDSKHFLEFIKKDFMNLDFKVVEKATIGQSACGEWYKMRFGRITASILYEAARCKTQGGYLVEKIMGASKPVETEAILRGKKLESEVLRCVEKEKKIKTKNSGLIIHKDFPIFGASPDGVSSDYVIEIKCPSQVKTVENYVKNNTINKKSYFQLQLNMFLLNKERGLFCVASPTFEQDNKVCIYEMSLNRNEIREMIELATTFWESNIFTELIKIN